jgi:hypothetical protein
MTGDPVDVYGLIAKRLLKGKVVPVLGAGVNLCEGRSWLRCWRGTTR